MNTPLPMDTTASLKSHSEHEPGIADTAMPETDIGSDGLKKQILKKGTSWQTPSPGDEVEVHFSGHIEDGELLDSSRTKGVPFTFKLGQCEVIKGWDEGVATMKKGERAIFRIPPNLAYGETGSPPLIAPNSTLFFDIELLSWKIIRDITGDGGVMKKVLKEGEGWPTPRDTDEVSVKYEARSEDGTVLYKTDGILNFHVSEDDQCPAITKSVKTMRKGEKAELAVKFSYGVNYDRSGNSDVKNGVLTDTNLTILIELVSWKSIIDVTGDSKVLKKITKAGEGIDHPNEGSRVQVIYSGKVEDGTIFETKGSDEEPFEFITMEEQINDGLDRAIMTMKKGEEAVVTVNVQHLSDKEGKDTMNSASLSYEVKLIDFTKEKPFWKMDTSEKIEACERKKHDGNLLFKAGKFCRAAKKYEKAANFVEFDHSFTDDEKSIAKELRLSCTLNNAACKLKLGEYNEVTRLCTKVLEVDPLNVKALFRRSQAFLKLSELEKAEEDIKKALNLDPNSRELKMEYKEIKEKQKEYGKYQAEIFSSMLSKMREPERNYME